MRRIFKLNLMVMDESQALTLPINARIVLIAPQRGEIYLWFEFEMNAARLHQVRYFRVHGTGHDIEQYEEHLASFVMEPFVWHVYEVKQ